ncbi:hypothetical protein CPC08DRAFT_714157 [Agrocybe pediades]|nr:hypothetical protein CPC08DRAFT_714157 [Agrocybe pediades]
MTQPGPPVPPQITLTHSILSGGTFNQHNYIHSGQRPGYTRPPKNVATAALHDSVDNVDPPKCHPNTRVAIMQNIHDWTVGTGAELSGKPILWLKGGAGAGKSAIARSVAERCAQEGLLLGAFFFGSADPTRNHVGKLVATLSYQISLVLPDFRDTVAAFIEQDPLIFSRSISTQFNTLIIRPFWRVLTNHSATLSTIPCLIIIDGLDECSAVNSQRDLLLTLQEVTKTTSLIRFLVCSRPESHLNNTFSLSHMVPIIYTIVLDDDYAASEDIKLFLEDKFQQIKEGHSFRHMLPDPWPTPKMVDDLVDKASRQFIYAATVVRYLESPRHRPDQRLRVIFGLQPPFKDLPFAELDALYWLIISKAEDLPTVLDILAFPTLYEAVQTKDIEDILQLEPGSVAVFLADLQSIIKVNKNGFVVLLHKSLEDFLSEPQRARDLYRDLPRVRLSHVALGMSLLSSHYDAVIGLRDCRYFSGAILTAIANVVLKLKESANMNADYISSDILRAAQQFPMAECCTFVFSNTSRVPEFQQLKDTSEQYLRFFLEYLYYIKDVCESTRLMYWEHMRHYCQSVLTMFQDEFNNWSSNAHFVFAYYRLLHNPCYHLPRKLSYVNIDDHIRGVCRLGVSDDYTIQKLNVGISKSHPDILQPCLHLEDIAKISCDLIGDIQKEAIFAMAADFCLEVLCNEQRIRRDAGRIYGLTRHDRRRRREHPWHWRQMVPRPPSLQNRVALVGFRHKEYEDYKLKLTRIRKALRTTTHYRYDNILVITMSEYSAEKFEPAQQQWLVEFDESGYQAWPLFLFVLDLLPRILPLAGRYEPLVDKCRKKCLSSMSQVWPNKSRRARQAIVSFLRRMDSQEEMEM